MIRILQESNEIEITGPFKIYGSQEDLLKLSTQIREQALKIQIGYVNIDTSLDTPVKKIVPFEAVK